MHVEVSVALNFVISYLYNKLPRRRVDGFGEELERGLKRKFQGHWYPEKPTKGSAFRCIRVSGEEMDPVIELSATASGLDMEEVKDYLPKDLTVWIDPNEVSYRIGEKGAVKMLYSNKRSNPVTEETVAMDTEVQIANKGFNPEAQSFRPIDSLSSSLTNLSLSPSPSGWGSTSPTLTTHTTTAASSTSPVTSFLTRNNNLTTFTAAAFAQTKFGSTKLKSHAKRPSRLSPTEFGAYIKQRSNFQTPSPSGHPGLVANGAFYGSSTGGMLPGGPAAPNPTTAQVLHGSLSPRDVHDPRQDFLDHQRLLFLQQQQQQQQQQQPQQQQQQQGLPHPSQADHLPYNLIMGSLLSPTSDTLSDLYLSAPQSTAVSPVGSGPNLLDLHQSPAKASSAPSLQGTPSPTEPSKTFLDSLNWNTLPPYANLHHLLVAN